MEIINFVSIYYLNVMYFEKIVWFKRKGAYEEIATDDWVIF